MEEIAVSQANADRASTEIGAEGENPVGKECLTVG